MPRHRAACAGLIALAPLVLLPAGARAEDVIVQGTTSVRDTGLLTQVLLPLWQQVHPDIALKYVAVGSGQAIVNTEQGQGDALLTHEPIGEAAFVAGGYSYEPVGRLTWYSRFVIAGPASDPAGIGTAAGHDPVTALERIAAAGSAGQVNFVSRGDLSGTNVRELTVWRKGRTPLQPNGEPSAAGAWYHRAQTGMSATLRIAEQCPFAGGACYVLTDLPTLRALQRSGAIHNLRVLVQHPAADVRGGSSLLLNPFHVYVANPAGTGHGNVPAALAFADFLTSPLVQHALLSWPAPTERAFTPAARPRIALTRRWPARARPGTAVLVAGTVSELLPGAPALHGSVSLLRWKDDRWVRAATAPLTGGGAFRIALRARAGRYRLAVPRLADVLATTRDLRMLRSADG